MPINNIWTINSATGGHGKRHLVGCHIQQTDTGFNFTKPNISEILASTTGSSLPTFNDVSYKGYTWTITATSLTPNGPGSGTWENDPHIADSEDGDWTAQAGSGEPAESAASANV